MGVEVEVNKPNAQKVKKQILSRYIITCEE